MIFMYCLDYFHVIPLWILCFVWIQSTTRSITAKPHPSQPIRNAVEVRRRGPTAWRPGRTVPWTTQRNKAPGLSLNQSVVYGSTPAHCCSMFKVVIETSLLCLSES